MSSWEGSWGAAGAGLRQRGRSWAGEASSKAGSSSPCCCSVLLAGNPLSQDILSLYQDPDGTRKLLNYMLDNLAGDSLTHFWRGLLLQQESKQLKGECLMTAFGWLANGPSCMYKPPVAEADVSCLSCILCYSQPFSLKPSTCKVFLAEAVFH